jgi:DNA-binding NarL/FixJ family response regulator
LAEVRTGRLDGDAVDAVLRAAGHELTPRPQRPAGLTAREVEILRLLARGLLNKQIARRLGIAPKTVGNHVEHIYAKIGVSSRAAAGLFATEHGLLEFGASAVAEAREQPLPRSRDEANTSWTR